MQIIETNVLSQIDTLNHILDLSAKYHKDISLFPNMNPREIFLFGQSRYEKEEQEILMRPKYYLQDRFVGDCDDFTILFLSYWIFKKQFPIKAFLVLAGRARISHVYPILVNTKTKQCFGMDALPKNEFGFVYTYPLMQFYTIGTNNKVSIEFNLQEFHNLCIDKRLQIIYKERK